MDIVTKYRQVKFTLWELDNKDWWTGADHVTYAVALADAARLKNQIMAAGLQAEIGED